MLATGWQALWWQTGTLSLRLSHPATRPQSANSWQTNTNCQPSLLSPLSSLRHFKPSGGWPSMKWSWWGGLTSVLISPPEPPSCSGRSEVVRMFEIFSRTWSWDISLLPSQPLVRSTAAPTETGFSFPVVGRGPGRARHTRQSLPLSTNI